VIGRILDASARHRALVLVAALLLAVAGWMSLQRVELDAIPDLGDTQVVVYSEWMGRAPSLVEDQVGYPLVTGLLGLPRVIDVRAQSMFGMSFVYVVFEEGTDLYWARARVQEALGALRSRLPPEVSPRMGPDATGVGWVYQYALVDRTGQTDLGALRTFHDTSLRYALQTVPGVAEVATVGGYEPQYQVTVDPERLRARGVTLMEVAEALRRANGEVGGRVIELSQREHFVRGRGWLGGPADLERAVIRARPDGASLRVSDVATVRWGPEIRRGAADLDGRGEVVSGIVVMRQGERARDVIGRVEARLRSLRSTLPAGRRGGARVRPPRHHRPRHRHPAPRPRGGDDRRRAGDRGVSPAHPQRAPAGHLVAPRGAPGLRADVPAAHPRDHHVARRHRHRHRGHRRRGDRDGGGRPQGPRRPAPRRHARGAIAQALRGRAGGDAGHLLLAAHHRRELHPGVWPHGPGGPALSPARVHQDLRDALGGPPVHHRGARAARPALAGQDGGRARSPGEPRDS
jgi:hypothetical protein